jgi:hypothetical protein
MSFLLPQHSGNQEVGYNGGMGMPSYILMYPQINLRSHCYTNHDDAVNQVNPVSQWNWIFNFGTLQSSANTTTVNLSENCYYFYYGGITYTDYSTYMNNNLGGFTPSVYVAPVAPKMTATTAMQQISKPIIDNSIGLTQNVIVNYWPYMLTISIITILIVKFKNLIAIK